MNSKTFDGKLVAKMGKLKYFEMGGGELVKPFQIVFDYQNRQIAFVKRDAKVP